MDYVKDKIQKELGFTIEETFYLTEALRSGNYTFFFTTSDKKVSGWIERIKPQDVLCYEVEIEKQSGNYPNVLLFYGVTKLRIVLLNVTFKDKDLNERISYSFDWQGNHIKTMWDFFPPFSNYRSFESLYCDSFFKS